MLQLSPSFHHHHHSSAQPQTRWRSRIWLQAARSVVNLLWLQLEENSHFTAIVMENRFNHPPQQDERDKRHCGRGVESTRLLLVLGCETYEHLSPSAAAARSSFRRIIIQQRQMITSPIALAPPSPSPYYPSFHYTYTSHMATIGYIHHHPPHQHRSWAEKRCQGWNDFFYPLVVASVIIIIAVNGGAHECHSHPLLLLSQQCSQDALTHRSCHFEVAPLHRNNHHRPSATDLFVILIQWWWWCLFCFSSGLLLVAISMERDRLPAFPFAI